MAGCLVIGPRATSCIWIWAIITLRCEHDIFLAGTGLIRRLQPSRTAMRIADCRMSETPSVRAAIQLPAWLLCLQGTIPDWSISWPSSSSSIVGLYDNALSGELAGFAFSQSLLRSSQQLKWPAHSLLLPSVPAGTLPAWTVSDAISNLWLNGNNLRGPMRNSTDGR